MITKKEKQNLRWKKSDLAFRKIFYKGLNRDQKRMVKLSQEQDIIEKYFDDFWRDAPRNVNGSVQWEKYSENDLDLFHFLDHRMKKVLKTIDTLESKGVNQLETKDLFNVLNTKSFSY